MDLQPTVCNPANSRLFIDSQIQWLTNIGCIINRRAAAFGEIINDELTRLNTLLDTRIINVAWTGIRIISCTVTIGVPAFVMSFRSVDEPCRPGYLRRVVRFALPAGLTAAAPSLCAVLMADNRSASPGRAPVSLALYRS